MRQDELALAAGVSTRAIHQIESGKPTSRLDTVSPVLAALGSEIEDRMNDATLSVFLRGELVGSLERTGPSRYRFAYSKDAIAGDLSDPMARLSASLPLREERFKPSESAPFFEGLLPEGAVRATIAGKLGLSEANGFGMLAALGADCAGAVMVLPEDQPPRSSEVSARPAQRKPDRRAAPRPSARSARHRRRPRRGAPELGRRSGQADPRPASLRCFRSTARRHAQQLPAKARARALRGAGGQRGVLHEGRGGIRERGCRNRAARARRDSLLVQRAFRSQPSMPMARRCVCIRRTCARPSACCRPRSTKPRAGHRWRQ